jgi:hypothetical protein
VHLKFVDSSATSFLDLQPMMLAAPFASKKVMEREAIALVTFPISPLEGPMT